MRNEGRGKRKQERGWRKEEKVKVSEKILDESGVRKKKPEKKNRTEVIGQEKESKGNGLISA